MRKGEKVYFEVVISLFREIFGFVDVVPNLIDVFIHGFFDKIQIF